MLPLNAMATATNPIWLLTLCILSYHNIKRGQKRILTNYQRTNFQKIFLSFFAFLAVNIHSLRMPWLLQSLFSGFHLKSRFFTSTRIFIIIAKPDKRFFHCLNANALQSNALSAIASHRHILNKSALHGNTPRALRECALWKWSERQFNPSVFLK